MRIGLPLAVLLALAACSDSSSTDVNASVAGTYVLQTINAQPLPVTLLAFGGTGGQDVIGGGIFVLKADGTWTSNLTGQSTGRGSIQSRDCCYSGTSTQSGNTLSLRPSPPNPWMGDAATISGVVLTYMERGQIFIYRKN